MFGDFSLRRDRNCTEAVRTSCLKYIDQWTEMKHHDMKLFCPQEFIPIFSWFVIFKCTLIIEIEMYWQICLKVIHNNTTYNYSYTHVENDRPWPVVCGIFCLLLSGLYIPHHAPKPRSQTWSRVNLWCVEGAIQNQFHVVTWAEHSQSGGRQWSHMSIRKFLQP